MLFTTPPATFRPPKKIVSIVPSITELLWHLGLEKETIGITKFCVHPPQWLNEKTRIGGTKNIHVDEIIALQPDLVIASREENVKEQVEAIAQHVPVFLTDVITIEDALRMIKEIGQLTGTNKRAQEIVNRIASQLPTTPTLPTNPSIYLIWKDPYMTVGGDTFINNMMRIAGFENIYSEQTRYPEVSPEDLAKSPSEFIFLSSEPYPFKQKHVEELTALLPGKKVMLVDGEMFSWYGSRMLLAAQYFEKLRRNLEI